MQDNNDIAWATFDAFAPVISIVSILIIIVVPLIIFNWVTTSKSKSESKSESESESIGGDALRRKERHMATEENESRASRDRLALETLISSLFLCGDILFEDGDDPKLIVNNADRTEISLTKAGARALREAGIPTREELEKEDEGDGLCDGLDGIRDDLNGFRDGLNAYRDSLDTYCLGLDAYRVDLYALRDSLNGIISCLSTFLRHEEGKGTMAEETE